MRLPEGRVFMDASPEQVIEHLRGLERNKITTTPEKLYISPEKDMLFLSVSNGTTKKYPIRKSFFFKLLKWFNLPKGQMKFLGIETFADIMNDYLLSIKSRTVNVKIEGGEAVTITSNRYTDLDDLYILENLSDLKIESVTRNDFFMRLYTEVKNKEEVLPGDDFGFGLNIINSETGFGALTIYNYLYRYICSNGAVIKVGDESRKVHYGFSPRDLKEFVDDNIIKAKMNQEKIKERVRFIHRQKLIDEQIKALEKRISYTIGKSESEIVLGGKGEGATMYDVYNTLTDIAKYYSPDIRLKMEELAGELIMN